MTATVAKLYDQRTAPRHSVGLDGTLRDDNNRPYEVVVSDLSLTGFVIPGSANLKIPSRIGLGLTGLGGRSAQVVRKDGQGWYGCVFDVPLTDAELNSVVVEKPKSTVVSLPWTPDPILDAPSFRDERLSPLVKVLIIAGATGALWGGLAAAVWPSL
ncbi:PilZ domain-containing protein [Sphingomonas sp. BK481]|uniref:PilZ domain-containing protein n=1 Tax=Sphingomonas sp. BK481 TaxID=2586981 RepID=UPI0039083574